MSDTPMVMVTAGPWRLSQVDAGRWSVSGPTGVDEFDSLAAAIDALDPEIGPETRIDYHDSLYDLQAELELQDRHHLFPDSPDGLWRVGGESVLWVPARAEDEWEEMFEEVGTFGDHGYTVRLYRWDGTYLLNYDESWEDRYSGWEVIGEVPLERAVEDAEEFAYHLDEDQCLLDSLNDPDVVAQLLANGSTEASIAAQRAELEWQIGAAEDDRCA